MFRFSRHFYVITEILFLEVRKRHILASLGNSFSAKLCSDLYELVALWLHCEIKCSWSLDIEVTFILNFLLIGVVSTFKSGTVIGIFHRNCSYRFFFTSIPVLLELFFFFVCWCILINADYFFTNQAICLLSDELCHAYLSK